MRRAAAEQVLRAGLARLGLDTQGISLLHGAAGGQLLQEGQQEGQEEQPGGELFDSATLLGAAAGGQQR